MGTGYVLSKYSVEVVSWYSSVHADLVNRMYVIIVYPISTRHVPGKSQVHTIFCYSQKQGVKLKYKKSLEIILIRDRWLKTFLQTVQLYKKAKR